MAALEEKDLPQYSGVYWSEELESQYTLRLKNGKLVADHAKHGETQFTPVMKDEFGTNSWFMSSVTFTRDESGRITGFKAGGGRLRGIAFARRPALAGDAQ